MRLVQFGFFLTSLACLLCPSESSFEKQPGQKRDIIPGDSIFRARIEEDVVRRLSYSSGSFESDLDSNSSDDSSVDDTQREDGCDENGHLLMDFELQYDTVAPGLISLIFKNYIELSFKGFGFISKLGEPLKVCPDSGECYPLPYLPDLLSQFLADPELYYVSKTIGDRINALSELLDGFHRDVNLAIANVMNDPPIYDTIPISERNLDAEFKESYQLKILKGVYGNFGLVKSVTLTFCKKFWSLGLSGLLKYHSQDDDQEEFLNDYFAFKDSYIILIYPGILDGRGDMTKFRKFLSQLYPDECIGEYLSDNFLLLLQFLSDLYTEAKQSLCVSFQKCADKVEEQLTHNFMDIFSVNKASKDSLFMENVVEQTILELLEAYYGRNGNEYKKFLFLAQLRDLEDLDLLEDAHFLDPKGGDPCLEPSSVLNQRLKDIKASDSNLWQILTDFIKFERFVESSNNDDLVKHADRWIAYWNKPNLNQYLYLGASKGYQIRATFDKQVYLSFLKQMRQIQELFQFQFSCKRLVCADASAPSEADPQAMHPNDASSASSKYMNVLKLKGIFEIHQQLSSYLIVEMLRPLYDLWSGLSNHVFGNIYDAITFFGHLYKIDMRHILSFQIPRGTWSAAVNFESDFESTNNPSNHDTVTLNIFLKDFLIKEPVFATLLPTEISHLALLAGHFKRKLDLAIVPSWLKGKIISDDLCLQDYLDDFSQKHHLSAVNEANSAQIETDEESENTVLFQKAALNVRYSRTELLAAFEMFWNVLDVEAYFIDDVEIPSSYSSFFVCDMATDTEEDFGRLTFLEASKRKQEAERENSLIREFSQNSVSFLKAMEGVRNKFIEKKYFEFIKDEDLQLELSDAVTFDIWLKWLKHPFHIFDDSRSTCSSWKDNLKIWRYVVDVKASIYSFMHLDSFYCPYRTETPLLSDMSTLDSLKFIVKDAVPLLSSDVMLKLGIKWQKFKTNDEFFRFTRHLRTSVPEIYKILFTKGAMETDGQTPSSEAPVTSNFQSTSLESETMHVGSLTDGGDPIFSFLQNALEFWGIRRVTHRRDFKSTHGSSSAHREVPPGDCDDSKTVFSHVGTVLRATLSPFFAPFFPVFKWIDENALQSVRKNIIIPTVDLLHQFFSVLSEFISNGLRNTFECVLLFDEEAYVPCVFNIISLFASRIIAFIILVSCLNYARPLSFLIIAEYLAFLYSVVLMKRRLALTVASSKVIRWWITSFLCLLKLDHFLRVRERIWRWYTTTRHHEYLHKSPSRPGEDLGVPVRANMPKGRHRSLLILRSAFSCMVSIAKDVLFHGCSCASIYFLLQILSSRSVDLTSWLFFPVVFLS